MLLRLSCSCGWSISQRVAEHVLCEFIELVLRDHPLGSHWLVPACSKVNSMVIENFLRQKMGLGKIHEPPRYVSNGRGGRRRRYVPAELQKWGGGKTWLKRSPKLFTR